MASGVQFEIASDGASGSSAGSCGASVFDEAGDHGPAADPETSCVFTALQGLVLEETKANGPRVLWSILNRLVQMTDREREECVDLYNGASPVAAGGGAPPAPA
eukprot:CAMPEP_0179312612 /NCGR_PEP_ID=MMETSP0797-20121207/53365_1 /TAXON_ID=47934 /ORGANISM="Dinophysis acuminata, Strain DAEP01" /LENGTH=103 /DNA_ID=CAMNT_0021022569 /DNA_START=37 /DNA_END=344 /DNA_ORIENTATION=+